MLDELALDGFGKANCGTDVAMDIPYLCMISLVQVQNDNGDTIHTIGF